jgi:hypothetical protein
MITLAPALRVYLACGVTDMRKYAEPPVMRSPAPKAGIPLAWQAILLCIITTSPRCAPHRRGRSCRVSTALRTGKIGYLDPDPLRWLVDQFTTDAVIMRSKMPRYTLQYWIPAPGSA